LASSISLCALFEMITLKVPSRTTPGLLCFGTQWSVASFVDGRLSHQKLGLELLGSRIARLKIAAA
jgi:hypothetical protein